MRNTQQMRRQKLTFQIRHILFCLLLFSIQSSFAKDLPLHWLKLPPHFSIQIYAAPVEGAREMARGSKDIIFVGSMTAGKIYAIIPDSHSPYKTKVLTIASGLTMPNGVAFQHGALYVADINRILRFDNIEQHLTNPPQPIVITDALPDSKHHGWRYIRFGPDGKLYIGIGAPCNACLSDDERFGTIMRMNADGSQQEIYARGVRNSLGFDWDSIKHNFWFTDNGRDWMGDNVPPDELNRASKTNLHFGFPYCHGKAIADPAYGKEFPCSSFEPPVVELPAHVAALGMLFYTGQMFPKNYAGQIFIAEHGSWNRSSKIGYEVISIDLSSNSFKIHPFITGWLHNKEVWGRPVDILALMDGSLLISDDYADVIYRVSYQS